jgi:hypothetical protein
MNGKLLDAIRIANREFQEFVEQYAQTGEKVVDSRRALRRLTKIDLRLKQVSRYLAGESKLLPPTPDAAYEVLKYRENLRSLRHVVETLQFSLLAEKARLENVRANLQAASAWATSLREIS